MNGKDNNDNQEPMKVKKFTRKMRTKLVVLSMAVLLAFLGLGARLVYINNQDGERYKKQVLSQLEYDSTTLAYRRGTIVDANGTTLAVSQKVYNLIIDSKVILSNEAFLQPTLDALDSCFEINTAELMQYIKEHPKSAYYKLFKQLSYEEISDFLAILEDKKTYPNVTGVWFEEEYKRFYPYATLGCDVLGFTTSDGVGMYGLEQYYNDYLTGTDGRRYGYLTEDSTVERTTIQALNGCTIQSTIDVNIQSIVEKYLLAFNEEHKNEYRAGEGSYHSACIVMNPKTGEVYAMAEYPNFDLNNPYSLARFYTEEEIQEMDTDTFYENLNALWSNFCISSTYEPGSTAKSFTIAAGLELGKLTGNESYHCGGGLQVADFYIHCNNRYGHGDVDVQKALEKSCNVALMHIGQTIGIANFLRFQSIFNFGRKTGIDLAGETKTSALVYNEKTMGPTELATSSFGQGYNVTMIQMCAAFSSLINGGYYYEPHLVSAIRTAEGNVLKEIEPRVLRQTVSRWTSAKMVKFLNAVVSEGTGKTAKPAGYSIGGKTGTAETAGRDRKNYVVSFIGYAPANDPQVVVYVVIDRPNVKDQAHAYYAAGVVKQIFTEILPYLNIFKTEELTDSEIEELTALGLYRNENGTYVDIETGLDYDPITGQYMDPLTGEVVETTGITAIEGE